MVDQRKLEREIFEAVLRQMYAGVVIAEAPSGRILLSNKRAEQIRRCALPLRVGIREYGEYDDRFRGFHPDGRPYEPEEWPLARSIRAGEVVVEEEIAIVRGDGTRGMIRVSSSPVRDEEGSIVAGVAVFFDFTEHKRAEEELRNSERRFRATFEQAAVGIAHSAPDGRWLRVNQKLCDIVGYSREELLGCTLQDITHPDDLEANLEQIRRLLAGEVETFSIEKRYIRKDGSTVWVNVTVSLVREPSGEPEYLIAVIEDITERKRVEAEVLRLNEELEERVRERTAQLEEKSIILDTVLDNLAEGVLLVNMRGRVLFANPIACTLLGIGCEKLPIKLTDLWRDSNRWRGFNLPDAVACCTKEQECIEVMVSSGGTFVRVNLRPLPPFGSMQGGALVVMQDLSAERRLEANQQRFLADAAHELKTPLATIMGAAELLLSEEEPPEVQRRFLQHIASEARRMQRLSDTLLRLARTGWDFREPQIQDQELDVVQTAVERMEPLAEKAGIALLLEDQEGCARVDPTWLEQALLILISNAIKYSDPGGRVRVYVDGSTIIVEDEGAGIKETDLPHVFERFYRGGDGREGSGLGLPLCKDLIERMGGNISISSQEGAGTTVRIKLPEAERASAGRR